jgi:N4-gp56 family major capsid protein
MLTWGVLKAGTNVAYANGAARTDVNTVIALEDIRGAVRGLKAQRGKSITSMLAGSPDYATKPVEGGYVAFAHTDLEADLRNLTGFTPVAAYGSRKPLCPEEIGSVENVRFILSPLLSSWADGGGAKGAMKSTTGVNADVYPVIVIAKEAYGLVPLKGEGAITPTVLNPGKPSKSDPLGQIGYVGWKTWFAAVRLNEAWMRRIEVAVTAL